MFNPKAMRYGLALLVAFFALAPVAQANIDTFTSREVARQAVAGIAFDLSGAEVSVFHCHQRGVHAACDVDIFGNFTELRAHVLETQWMTDYHYQVRQLRVVNDHTKPDPAP